MNKWRGNSSENGALIHHIVSLRLIYDLQHKYGQLNMYRHTYKERSEYGGLELLENGLRWHSSFTHYIFTHGTGSKIPSHLHRSCTETTFSNNRNCPQKQKIYASFTSLVMETFPVQ